MFFGIQVVLAQEINPGEQQQLISTKLTPPCSGGDRHHQQYVAELLRQRLVRRGGATGADSAF